MAKKAQRKKKTFAANQVLVQSQQLLDYLNQLQFDLFEGKFDSVLRISQILMSYLPSSSPHLPEVLLKRGTALMAMQQYEEAYDVLTKAAGLAPNDSLLLYMYAQVCMYAQRLGKASIIIEKAVKLEPAFLKDKSMKTTIDLIREGTKGELELRGKDFTLEQLIEQEELEIAGIELSQNGKFEEAEQVFRQVIAMADVLPQPHNNLASCLMHQGKFKEAEQELLISLKIEPHNPVAVHNLPGVRKAIQTGEMPEFGGVYHPFKDYIEGSRI